MNLFDYLNSKRGSSLLALYAAIAVIAAVIVLTFIIVIRTNAKDIPATAAWMLGIVLGAAFGTHLAEVKIAQPDPDKATATTQVSATLIEVPRPAGSSPETPTTS